jgi:GNAT superfamily N-acetyltransferase
MELLKKAREYKETRDQTLEFLKREYLRLYVFEGNNVASIHGDFGNQFEDRCQDHVVATFFDESSGGKFQKVVTDGISRGYISGKFLKNSRANSAFLIVGVDNANRLAGYVKGNVYDDWYGADKVLVIDIICAARTEGRVGSALLSETEQYAESLGAKMIALHSVMNPKTLGFYRKRGFLRRMNACTDEHDERGRKDYEHVMKVAAGRVSKQYTDALAGKYFHGANSPENTVVMTKCLTQAARNSPLVDWNTGRFLQPRHRFLLGHYYKTTDGWKPMRRSQRLARR